MKYKQKTTCSWVLFTPYLLLHAIPLYSEINEIMTKKKKKEQKNKWRPENRKLHVLHDNDGTQPLQLAKTTRIQAQGLKVARNLKLETIPKDHLVRDSEHVKEASELRKAVDSNVIPKVDILQEI